MSPPMKPREAYNAFREAVLDLVEEPTPKNARRALAASRLLERVRREVRRGPRTQIPSG